MHMNIVHNAYKIFDLILFNDLFVNIQMAKKIKL